MGTHPEKEERAANFNLRSRASEPTLTVALLATATCHGANARGRYFQDFWQLRTSVAAWMAVDGLRMGT